MNAIINKYIKDNLILKTLFLNLSFLVLYVFICNPVFETNDDTGMCNIVSGGYGNYYSHTIFINLILGKVLSAIMNLFPHIKLYVVFFYIFMFCSFFVITYIIYKYFSNFALIINSIFLLYFGYECYVQVQFTKVSGVMSIAGVLLIMNSFESDKFKKKSFMLGIIILYFGCMVRFAACGLIIMIMYVLGIDYLTNKIKKKSKKNIVIFITSWSIILVGLFLIVKVDSYAYEKETDWKYYKIFNEKRAILLDNGFPSFDEHESEYTQLGLNANDIYLYSNWTFADPDIFTVKLMDEIIKFKSKKIITPQRILNVFSREIITGYLQETFFIPILILIIFWLLFYKKKYWILFINFIGLFFINCYFICINRYLLHRVDVIIWMAEFITLIFLMKDKKTNITIDYKKQLFIIAAISFSMLNTIVLNIIPKDKINNNAKDIIEYIKDDKQHLYLIDVYSDPTPNAYTIFSPINKGDIDNIYLLGGWGTNTPYTLKILDNYNIHNPFQDCVDNKKIYIIDNYKIDQIITYINDHYNTDAYAVLEQTLYGYKIYSIRSY